MRKLYVHLGNHRTGTTSIQEFMFANRGKLAAQGILFPNNTRRHLALMDGLFEKGNGARIAEDLEAKAEARGVHTVVLSEEDVCKRTDLSPLAALAERFDVRLVFVMRRQDLWLESWFSQNVKWQWDEELRHMDWDAFLAGRARFHWIDYDATVARLEALFGPEAVELAVFDRELMPEGPVAAFARIVGVRDLSVLGKMPTLNYGFSPMMSEVMRRLPLHEAEGPLRAKINRACEAADRAWQERHGKVAKRIMDPETRRAVMGEYEAGNARLARRRFGRDALFAEPLPGADAPYGAPALPADPERLVDDLVAPMISDLIRRLAPKTEAP